MPQVVPRAALRKIEQVATPRGQTIGQVVPIASGDLQFGRPVVERCAPHAQLHCFATLTVHSDEVRWVRRVPVASSPCPIGFADRRSQRS
jgi:hypothetical protein